MSHPSHWGLCFVSGLKETSGSHFHSAQVGAAPLLVMKYPRLTTSFHPNNSRVRHGGGAEAAAEYWFTRGLRTPFNLGADIIDF